MFTRFPAHRSAEEGTKDLHCELGKHLFSRGKDVYAILLTGFGLA